MGWDDAAVDVEAIGVELEGGELVEVDDGLVRVDVDDTGIGLAEGNL